MIAKITLCLGLFLFFIPTNTNAQNFEWGFGTGSPGTDLRTGAVVDENGDIISVGSFYGMVDFDPMNAGLTATSNGESDVFVEKRSANGDLIWLKTFGGASYDAPNSVVVDSEGNIIVFGRFWGITDFDPSDADFEMDGEPSGSIFLLKFNPDGEFNWVKALMGNTILPPGEIMTINTNDEIILTGGFKGTVDFDPSDEDASETVGELFSELFIAKYTAAAEFIWVKVIKGNGFKFAREVAVNNNGDIYTAGTYTNMIDLDPSASPDVHINTSEAGNGFIVALDESGEFIWGADLASDSYSSVDALKVQDDYIAIAGTFSGVTDFDFGDGIETRNSPDNYDTFIQKLNLDGELIWVNAYESNSFPDLAGIVINSFGDIVVSGSYADQMDFDHSANTELRTTTGAADYDGFIHQVSTTGEFQRVYIISGEMQQQPAGIVISNANELYVYGEYSNEIVFEPGGTATSAYGSFDNFLIKLGEVASIDSSEEQNVFSFYPNPSKQNLTINKTTQQTVEILNILGETVVFIAAGQTIEKIDLSSLATGTYFVKASDGTKTATKKLVVS